MIRYIKEYFASYIIFLILYLIGKITGLIQTYKYFEQTTVTGVLEGVIIAIGWGFVLAIVSIVIKVLGTEFIKYLRKG